MLRRENIIYLVRNVVLVITLFVVGFLFCSGIDNNDRNGPATPAQQPASKFSANNCSTAIKNLGQPLIAPASSVTEGRCHIGSEQYRLAQEVGTILEQELRTNAAAASNLIDCLGKTGSESTISSLINLAGDKGLEPSVRAAAVSAIDWNGAKETLFQLLSNNEEDPQVKTALVTSSSRIELDESQRERFNKVIYDNLMQEKDDGVITISLNYFADMDPSWRIRAYTHLFSTGASSAVMEYILSDIGSSEVLYAHFPSLSSSPFGKTGDNFNRSINFPGM